MYIFKLDILFLSDVFWPAGKGFLFIFELHF